TVAAGGPADCPLPARVLSWWSVLPCPPPGGVDEKPRRDVRTAAAMSMNPPPDPAPPPRGDRAGALAAVALAALTPLAHAPVLAGGYEFLNIDDNEYVTDNPHVRAGLTGRSLLWAFTAFEANNWHPLTWVSLQLDYQLHGLDPRGYHVTNVLL